VITIHISSTSLGLSTGPTIHAGRVIFRVVTARGDHQLQIARLHRGYTLAEASIDIGKSFSGDVAAIRRVDSHITFRGGAEARPNHPGRVGVILRAGHYVFLDTNSSAHRIVTVTGTPPARAAIPHQSYITTFTYGFGTSTGPLPATGWTRIWNQSDQPHFVVFQHVKADTTARMVRRAFASMSPGQPPWILRANTSAGVISPFRVEILHYNLPAGKYLIACYWPDDDTGMPHAFMGMWKLIWLK
jgi:hypothetical protein